VGGAVTKVDEGGQQAVDEHQAMVRTATYGPLPWSGSQAGLVSSRHNGPISATSSAITPAVRPVIRRLLMITARVGFPTTRPCQPSRNQRSPRLPCTSSSGDVVVQHVQDALWAQPVRPPGAGP
jgi:hypothetical protein